MAEPPFKISLPEGRRELADCITLSCLLFAAERLEMKPDFL
jgi:hypothetical protein